MTRSAPLLLLLALAGCLRDTPRHLDLGLCAGDPATSASGDVPIGTCLAGPVDLKFVQREGRPWLAVANADPFINFEGGSLLLIDWEDLSAQLDRDTLRIDTLRAEALPTERFVAGFGVVEDRDLAILTRRLTEGGRTRSGEDSAYVIDLERLELWAEGDTIRLKDDPGDVVVADDRAWVLNYTDHSVSVVDTRSTPLIPVDLAPAASIAATPFVDADGSGSVAELHRLSIDLPGERRGEIDTSMVPDDIWTLQYLPGSVRAWGANGRGLSLWSSGGGPYQASAVVDYVDPGAGVARMEEPAAAFVRVDEVAGIGASFLFVSDGQIWQIVGNAVAAAAWEPPTQILFGTAGWDAVRGGPSRAVLPTGFALYYDGASADAPDQAAIGVATSDDGRQWRPQDQPLLVPPPGHSYEHPFAQQDLRTGEVRMWLSVHDGDRYHVAHTAAVDGLGFPEPQIVASLPDGLAAPTVRHADGRYQLWAATPDVDRWVHVHATSADGFTWSQPQVLFESDLAFDPRHPPRLAVEAHTGGGWRITGLDNGQLNEPIYAGTQYIDPAHGVRLGVAAGHELPNDAFPGGQARQGLFPTSQAGAGLFVTTVGEDGASRIGRLDGLDGDWAVVGTDLIPRGTGGNAAGASHPTVRQLPGGWVMAYTAWNGEGIGRIRFATSADGLTWTPRGEGPALPELGEWAGASQEARTLELLEDGGARLWLSGTNGSRYRIGAVVAEAFDPAAPQAATWTLDPGLSADWQLAPGLPGGVDDSGVKDPVVVEVDGQRQMIYAAYDGLFWHLARAIWVDGAWRRRTDPVTGATLPAMSGLGRTFSSGGVDNPVVRDRGDGQLDLWYAGLDLPSEEAGARRLGAGAVRGASAFADPRLPTWGDTLGYITTRGDDVVSAIELGQDVNAFRSLGYGTTSLIHDADRGFLYIPSKLSDLLYVVDIRDDSRQDFVDHNAFDLETLVRFPVSLGGNGLRGGVLHPGRDRLYLTTTRPDGVLVMDTSAIADDAAKEITDLPTVGVLPLQGDHQDAGSDTVALIGGAHPVLAGDLLLVPHFRDNSVVVFDLDLGPHGAEIAYIPWVGENPHRITVSPDGRFAVVANYIGDVDDAELSSSTLALIDLDPSSPTWLQVVHWITNR